jgi:hypothetical protein
MGPKKIKKRYASQKRRSLRLSLAIIKGITKKCKIKISLYNTNPKVAGCDQYVSTIGRSNRIVVRIFGDGIVHLYKQKELSRSKRKKNRGHFKFAHPDSDKNGYDCFNVTVGNELSKIYSDIKKYIKSTIE